MCLRNCSMWWSSLLLAEARIQENALSVVHSFLFRKAVRSNRESLIRCLFSQLWWSLSFFLCILSFFPCLSPQLYLPLYGFHFLLNILLSIRKSPLLQLPAGKIPLCWIFKEQSGKPQTHVIFASLRWTLVLTVASPFSSSSKRVAESACSWKGFPCISLFQT